MGLGRILPCPKAGEPFLSANGTLPKPIVLFLDSAASGARIYI